LVRPWLIVLVLCLLYLGVVLARNNGDPLAFAVIGSRYQVGDPAGADGYDGQFAYYLALDPIGAADKLDAPAYRTQRILYPMLARWLALGQPDWIPWTLVLVNLVALVAGTALMEQFLRHFGVSWWYALVYGLYAGQLLVFAGACGLYLLLAAGWRPALRFSLIAGAPFALWQLFLWRWLGSTGLGSGGAMATPFEFVPLMGLWRIGTVSSAALLLYGVILGPLVVLPTLWALWRTGRELLRRRWHPVTLALFANAAVLLFLPYSSWRELLAMLRLSTGLVAAVLLYAGLRRDHRILNYSWGWLAALAFLIKEGPGV
jgi:hypothetical protein